MIQRQPNPFDYLKKPSILQMGLTPVALEQLIQPFDDLLLSLFQEHKSRVLKKKPDVLQANSGAQNALLELQAFLQAHLSRYHGFDVVPADPEDVSAHHLLAHISEWMPDDICIIQPESELVSDAGASGDDEFILSAVSVCSPSAWLPEEKFMQPISQIHAPVPGLEKQLLPKMNRFLTHLKPEYPVVRFNWSLQWGDALYRNPAVSDEPKAFPNNVGNLEDTVEIFYRTERQVLLRLPITGAIVFFIRTQISPLGELWGASEGNDSEQTVSPALLINYISRLPAEQRAYKNLDTILTTLQQIRSD